MAWRLVHLIPLLSWPNEVLQSAAPAVDSCMVNFCYFPCKDETDLFSRCFEYSAHACHIAQESQRCVFVTAGLTNIGMMPNVLTVLFNASCAMRCKNGVPHICHAFRTWTWPLAERQSPTWLSHLKMQHDLTRSLKHCCIAAGNLISRKVDAQRGREQL